MITFFKNRPRWHYPEFNSSSRKRGGADAFENDPPLRSKGTVVSRFVASKQGGLQL
jgi:hypothetical protein